MRKKDRQLRKIVRDLQNKPIIRYISKKPSEMEKLKEALAKAFDKKQQERASSHRSS